MESVFKGAQDNPVIPFHLGFQMESMNSVYDNDNVCKPAVQAGQDEFSVRICNAAVWWKIAVEKTVDQMDDCDV